MKSLNNAIKYFAIALAVAIIVGICTGVISLVAGISEGFSFSGADADPQNIIDKSNGSILYIEVGAANIIVKDGDELSASTTNEYISVDKVGDKLVVIEHSHKLTNTESSAVEITVPKEFSFDSVTVSTGAGNITFESLFCKDLDLDFGAGNIEFGFLKVTDDFDVESGVGKLTVKDGEISDADLSLGVGNCSIRARFTGDNSIEAGVGDLDLVLLGGEELYTVEAEVGIGEFRADGKKVDSEETFGNGPTKLEIEGGIGQIKVEFE